MSCLFVRFIWYLAAGNCFRQLIFYCRSTEIRSFSFDWKKNFAKTGNLKFAKSYLKLTATESSFATCIIPRRARSFRLREVARKPIRVVMEFDIITRVLNLLRMCGAREMREHNFHPRGNLQSPTSNELAEVSFFYFAIIKVHGNLRYHLQPLSSRAKKSSRDLRERQT